MRESPQLAVFRCAIAGGYECPGPGLYCGVPCDGYPEAPAGPPAAGERRPAAPLDARVDWCCRACALEIPGRYIWDLRAHRLCPACGGSLSLIEIDPGGVPLGLTAPPGPR